MKIFSKKFITAANEPLSPEQQSIERGQKEISKYSPEYTFLVKLVQIVTKEGVPASEIKAIAHAYPFQTIDDLGDLTAKVWTLATQKYNIPSEWLAKRLPKNASLKTAAADRWPAQKATQDMLNHAPGYLAYDYGQEITSKSKKLNITQIIEILNNSDTKIARVDAAARTLELVDGSIVSFDDAAKRAMEIDKQGNFSGAEFSTTDFNTNPTLDNGPFSSPEDHGATPQTSQFPNTNWLPADDENKDAQPYSNVASTMKSFTKKATPPTRLWVAPDGTEFDAGGNHGAWIKNKNNLVILKKYGINTSKELYEIYAQMYASGWVRISNEPSGTGFQIQVGDINNVPSFVDDLIAKYFAPEDTVLISGDERAPGVSLSDPFPSIQQAIRKAPKNASTKEADLSSKVVNEILNTVHANGGITYNLNSGNLTGSIGYSVATHPERAVILPSGVDFDELENFITNNEDLLNDPSNSIGVWANDGKTYLDVVSVVQDRDQAIELGKQHNQIAIWDLQKQQEIPTGGTGALAKAFNKNSLIKQAETQVLCQEDQNAIAAASSPVYNIALINYAEAVKRGHAKDRALEYAVNSVINVEKIDPKKLVEFINTYL